MKIRPVMRSILQGCASLFLIWLGWQAIRGGLRQTGHARTIGQKVETVVQIASGGLSFIVVLTSFRWQRLARPVRTAWGVSLAATSGLSALVWGPPMPWIGITFAIAAIFITRTVISILPKQE